ncbi:MAG TPA: GNAT family N-acetyltransferase [Phycisphaerae bacterium]|nr:GNAT family N-acetyltransferase [Phycisphaerae bacterium]
MVAITQAQTERDIGIVRELFLRYADSLGFDLSFQNFDTELETFPGDYAPPGGCLLLARDSEEAVGCVGLRPLEAGICEMKRLYVRPECRGRGAGQALARAVIEEARRIGCGRMRLDTVPSMTAANALYESLGFVDIEPYRHNPLPEARYMELVL